MTATDNAREGDGVADLSERRALRKALDALDALSEAWAEEANIRGMCANIAKAHNLPEAIYALALQAWVEGAYAGRTSHHDHPAMQAQQGAAPKEAGESRFFIDHGIVHDRQTGKHLRGTDEYGDKAANLLAVLQELEQAAHKPMKLHFTNEWLRQAIESDPDDAEQEVDSLANPPVDQRQEGECTCPSGDGSLRWPCPRHPPEAASPPDAAAVDETLIDDLEQLAEWSFNAECCNSQFPINYLRRICKQAAARLADLVPIATHPAGRDAKDGTS